ncbi:MAG: GIY-YIG nuclease family protein [Desulfobacterales bacterium]|nr:GIY-YIG nuclease family protein [Desulfobacterales bacterium]
MNNHLKKAPWAVYILRNEKNALYTGITTDIKRRLNEHTSKSLKGAKFTRACKTLDLVYHCEIGERGPALTVESKIKRLKKDQKERIVAKGMKKIELYEFLALPLR